jgi:hypothetical protein
MSLFRSLCSPLVFAALLVAGCSSADPGSTDGSAQSDAALPGDAARPGDLTLVDGSHAADAAAPEDLGTPGDGGPASDMAHPPLLPRLFVSHAGGVAVWDHPEALTADVAPTAQLTKDGLAKGAVSLALAGNRLLVSSADPAAALLAFDAADHLGSDATAAAKIAQLPPVAGAHSGTPFNSLTVDAGDHLWARLGDRSSYGDGVALFTGASTLSSTSSARAVFTHPWLQMAGYAFDPVAGRLFVSQISGAGLLVWNDALHATGAKSHDFVLGQEVSWWMGLQGTRLYGVSSGSGPTNASVTVWQPLSALSAPTAPAITNHKLLGPAFISYFDLRDDTLAVAIENYGVYIYRSASTLTADTPPSVQVIDPAMSTSVVVTKLALTANGRLYVLLPDRVLVFRDATTTPVLAATLKSSLTKPTDLVVLE